MALGWLTALKAVPWADVVQAAPGIVKGARKLFTAAKSYAGSAGEESAAAAGGAPGGGADARLQGLEADIEALKGEQSASAALIRSLAEQNASIVTALDVMRIRLRIVFGLCIALVLSLAALTFVVIVK
jgi:hypothetical protein